MKKFTLSQKEEILNLYDKMRVTDVRDGMDWMGYHHYGSMGPTMRPLWPTKAMGFAKTARYIPYDRPVPQGCVGSGPTGFTRTSASIRGWTKLRSTTCSASTSPTSALA